MHPSDDFDRDTRSRLVPRHIAMLAAACGLVFLCDLVTPLELDIWIAYLAIILVSFRSGSARLVYLAAGLATALVLAASFVRPPKGGNTTIHLLDVGMGIGTLWTGTLIQIGRQRAELARRDSEEAFRLLVDGVKDYAIFMLDREGRVRTWNGGAQLLLQFREEEIVGQPYARFFPADDAAAGLPEAELAEAVRAGSCDDTGWRRRKDGTRFWANGVLTALFDADGQLRGYAKIMRDLTERRRDDLHLTAVLENAFDGIVSIDESGQILTFNRTAEKIFGYSRDEVLGRELSILLPETHGSGHEDHLRRYLARDSNPRIGTVREMEGLRKDGSRLPLQVCLTDFVEEGSGRRISTVVLHDVADLRGLERQLHQAQKMEAIGRLAGGVAHDFNNILAVVKGYSELIDEGLERLAVQEAPALRRDLATVLRAVGRAAALTRQLLAFSRQQTLQPTILGLNGAVLELEKMLRRLIGEDIALTVDTSPEDPHICADSGQLQQVLLNLAVNARDAMPSGGCLAIRVDATRFEAPRPSHVGTVVPGAFAIVEVADTGHGIDPAIHERIFEPFFTTKEQGRGTGLGLATVFGIVTQGGGFIELASSVGRGSTFRVGFPRVAPAEPRSAPLPRSTDASVEGGTVLLVEDEEEVRVMVRLMLVRLGFAVLEAASGEQALAIFDRHQALIRLVISDLVMPGMTGQDLLNRLRAGCPDVRFILISGYSGERLNGIIPTDTALLHKPFGIQELRTYIESALVLDRSVPTGD